MTDLADDPKLEDLVPAYVVNDKEYANNLAKDLFINRTDLTGEFARHAERYAFYSTCYELASARVEILQANLERLYAKLDSEKRGEFSGSGQKVTEKVIEGAVLQDTRYVDFLGKLLEAKEACGVLKAAMTSMQHRKDMLIQLGSAARAEMQADLVVKGNAVRGNTP